MNFASTDPAASHVLPAVVLVVFLALAAVKDWRTHRIPNALAAAMATAGILLAVVTSESWTHAIGWSLAGLAAGGLVMLPLYGLRVLGAGDVKLMAAAGAYLGPVDILHAALLVFMAGGVLAVLVAARHGALRRLLRNAGAIARRAGLAAVGRTGVSHGTPASAGKIPYAAAIACGAGGLALARALPA